MVTFSALGKGYINTPKSFLKGNLTYLEACPISLIVCNSSGNESGKVFRPIQITPETHEHYLVGGK